MVKALVINLENCLGCRLCEMVCSAKHQGVINPYRSRIRVIVKDRDWEGIPTTCVQCEDAQCASVCPVKAITRDAVLGRLVINYDRCIGCRMCITACPFGFMTFDFIDKKVIKCDLCDGEPQCAKFCAHQAIEYLDVSDLGVAKRRITGEKLSAYVRGNIRNVASVPAEIDAKFSGSNRPT